MVIMSVNNHATKNHYYFQAYPIEAICVDGDESTATTTPEACCSSDTSSSSSTPTPAVSPLLTSVSLPCTDEVSSSSSSSSSLCWSSHSLLLLGGGGGYHSEGAAQRLEDECHTATNTTPPPLLPEEVTSTSPLLSALVADLEKAQTLYGNTHVLVAEAWTAVGLHRAHMQGKPLQAKACFEYALSIYNRHESVPTSLAAVTLLDLGGTQERLHEFQAARSSYQRALDLLLKDNNDDDNHNTTSMHVLSAKNALGRLSRT